MSLKICSKIDYTGRDCSLKKISVRSCAGWKIDVEHCGDREIRKDNGKAVKMNYVEQKRCGFVSKNACLNRLQSNKKGFNH
jgi:hypothetical protein